MNQVKHLFGVLIFTCLVSAQALDVNTLANLLVKASYFNKIKSDKFVIVYGSSEEGRAKKLNKLVGGKAVEISSVQKSIDYQNVIFIGLTPDEIASVKGNYKKVLTISDDPKNIEVVSLAFGIKDNGRPLILVNLTLAKNEADFKSQFLKIAQVK